jgi:2-iminobutanoate/2-iminopropanoate deaminase
VEPTASIQSWTFGAADGVPDPVAPYAHVTEWNGTLHVTGQMPIDPAIGAVVGGGVGPQTDQVMRNLARCLELVGSSLDAVVQARAYITDMALYDGFNAAYARWFTRLPSRTCVAVSGLAVGALVEVDLVAVRT